MYQVYDCLTDAARKWPDAIAVIDEYGEITYAELLAHTEVLAMQLKQQGCAYGLGLGIIMPNNRYFIICLFAGVACGCVVMPIDQRLSNTEIDQAIRDANLHYVLSVQQLDGDAVSFCNLITALPTPLNVYNTARNADSLAVPFLPKAVFMRFTSGTTGAAKGVVLTHQSVMERTAAANEQLCLGTIDRVVWVLPMAYHFIVSIVLYVRYGVGIIVNELFLADSILQSIARHRGTFLYAAPMHLQLLANCKTPPPLPSLRMVIATTTGISATVCKAFQARYGLPVSQAYGIIEIGLPIINFQKSDEFPEAVGYPLPAYSVAILGDDFQPLPPDALGKLAIKGPGMFDAYLSPPTLRADVLKNGWFLTGDLAVCKPDDLIIISGREKNMINVSGNKVFPNEVEQVVDTYPGIVTSKAYSRTHPLMGEVVALDIVVADGYVVDTEQLIHYCRQYLTGFKLPQFVNQVEQIATTGSGKVKRH